MVKGHGVEVLLPCPAKGKLAEPGARLAEPRLDEDSGTTGTGFRGAGRALDHIAHPLQGAGGPVRSGDGLLDPGLPPEARVSRVRRGVEAPIDGVEGAVRGLKGAGPRYALRASGKTDKGEVGVGDRGRANQGRVAADDSHHQDGGGRHGVRTVGRDVQRVGVPIGRHWDVAFRAIEPGQRGAGLGLAIPEPEADAAIAPGHRRGSLVADPDEPAAGRHEGGGRDDASG